MVNKDYYQILDLSNNASVDEIKRAYRKLAMRYHPDRNHGKEEWAHGKFKEINEAFSVLGDPKKKRQYDHFGMVGNTGDIFDSQAMRTSVEELMKDFDGADLKFDFLNDDFADIFRVRGFTFRSFRRSSGGPGGIHESNDLEDLFEHSPGHKVSGVNYEIFLSKEQACKGMENELVRNGKRLQVKIPAGVKMGTRIRLRDALKITDGQPGDIMVRIKVK